MLTVLSVTAGFLPDNSSYKLYDKTGTPIEFSQMINKLYEADIILFGELHTDSVCHLLEQAVLQSMFDKKKENLIIGAEMFEADNQLILDEFLEGKIGKRQFENEMRLWPNYKTDYKPLVIFAKENQLKFVATNIPRRYASVVSDKGLEGLNILSKEAKKYMAPLPMKYDSTLNCYKSMLTMDDSSSAKLPHGGIYFPQAQASKDATMTYFIMKYWSKNKTLLHFNGAYHSDNFESMVWYLKKMKKNLKIVTISTVTQKDISKLSDENKNIADFIFCTVEAKSDEPEETNKKDSLINKKDTLLNNKEIQIKKE